MCFSICCVCVCCFYFCVFFPPHVCVCTSRQDNALLHSHTLTALYIPAVWMSQCLGREKHVKRRDIPSQTRTSSPLISLAGRFPSPFHSAPLLLHWLSIPLTSFISFSSLPRGVYRQLHYSSGTNSHSTLNMYPLKLALVAAVGDISHFLLNRKKNKKKQLRQCLPSHVNHSKL